MPTEPSRSFPDDTCQAILGDFWKATPGDKSLRRGRLVNAFVPIVTTEPMRLDIVGRGADVTDHSRATYRIETLRIAQSKTLPKLPVAALPLFSGETHVVYKAKVRPCVVLCVGGPNVPKNLTQGFPAWQTAPMLTVAPFFGAEKTPTRAGFPPALVERIRRAEYPHLIWDRLPGSFQHSSAESVLRLDQAQPVGRHHHSYEATEWCLTDEAVGVMDEWLGWLRTGELDAEGMLNTLKKMIGEVVAIGA